MALVVKPNSAALAVVIGQAIQLADSRVGEFISDVVATGELPDWLLSSAKKGGRALYQRASAKFRKEFAAGPIRKLGPVSRQSAAQSTDPPVITYPRGSMGKSGKGKQVGKPRVSRGIGGNGGIGMPSSPTVSLHGVISTGNGGTGLLNGQYPLAINSNISGASLGVIFGTALTNWVGIFRMWKLLRAKVTFVSGSPNTVSGNVALGVDPEPLAGLPGSYNNCVRHDSHIFVPIFSNGTMVWVPRSARDKEDKFTALLTHDETEVSFGTIQIYSANSAASGTSVGALMIDLTIKFSESC